MDHRIKKVPNSVPAPASLAELAVPAPAVPAPAVPVPAPADVPVPAIPAPFPVPAAPQIAQLMQMLQYPPHAFANMYQPYGGFYPTNTLSHLPPAFGAPPPAHMPPTFTSQASANLANVSLAVSLPRPISLEEFCQRYAILPQDQVKLKKLDVIPGDHEELLSLERVDWEERAGFAKLTWDRFLKVHLKFLDDVRNGLWAA
jgi:hypothetical protein